MNQDKRIALEPYQLHFDEIEDLSWRSTIYSTIQEQSFIDCLFIRDQIAFLYQRLTFDKPKVPLQILVTLFGFKKSQNIIYHLKKANGLIRNPGRPSILSEIELESYIENVSIHVEQRTLFTFETFIDFIQENFQKIYSTLQIKHFIFYHHEIFQTVKGIPFEFGRNNLKLVDIENYYDALRRKVARLYPSLIFNIDESGFSEFVDVKSV